jgi:hypothetical protein
VSLSWRFILFMLFSLLHVIKLIENIYDDRVSGVFSQKVFRELVSSACMQRIVNLISSIIKF